jgi:membrane-anchored protein YejM (alkaline phosphatase superfamily)
LEHRSSYLLTRVGPLGRYFVLTWFVTLLNAAGYLFQVRAVGLPAHFLVAAVFVTHCLLYLLPVWIAAVGLDFAFSPRLLCRFTGRAVGSVVVYGVAVLGAGLVQNLLFVDRFIFRLYGFHLNGFVWNLVFTRGGIESLGGTPSAMLLSSLIVLGFFLLQGGLLVVVLKVRVVRSILARLLRRRGLVTAVVVLGVLFVAQLIGYGVCDIVDYTPGLATADVFPNHVHVTFAGLAEDLFGIKPAKRYVFRTGEINLKYPREPLRLSPDRRKYNIVWLVAESWRRDMLDPEIMPATWAFAGKATGFTQHYSGGNGTRMGVFALFYGLYGPYWNAFLSERRGPVLMDVVMDGGYQMEMFTSARFTYPEFERTIFARVPSEHLHECDQGEGWQRDRINTQALVDFIRGRDRSRPFMTFCFFESPHAHYYFPPECAIRKPFTEDLNYLTMDLGPAGVNFVKNRYVNSCHHLDTQFRRIIDCLGEERLLDETIVVMTGDHGEEFMEKGRWGHNSEYSEEQTLVPLVLWTPGRSPAVVDRLTSHLDVPATVLAALGVENPPEDYSLGFDLFGPRVREYTVLSGYDNIGYVDSEYKAVFPAGGAGAWNEGREVRTKNDASGPDRAAFMESRRERLVQIMRDLGRFKR